METDPYSYRAYLFKLAYGLTGEIALSEDLVQDTFENWLKTDKQHVKEPKKYLSRMLINMVYDLHGQLKKERDNYLGTWLPEPIISSDDEPMEGGIDLAMLYLLERLNPYERAIFVLKEAFGLDHAEIAEITGLKQDNCRQLLHRARERVHRKKNLDIDGNAVERLLQAFSTAIINNDLEGLKLILKEDICIYSDGGGKATAALNVIHGHISAAKLLLGLSAKNADKDLKVHSVYVNGRAAYLFLEKEKFYSLIYPEVTENQISNIFILRNPEKFHGMLSQKRH